MRCCCHECVAAEHNGPTHSQWGMSPLQNAMAQVVTSKTADCLQPQYKDKALPATCSAGMLLFPALSFNH